MNAAQKHNFGASSRILPEYLLNRVADAVKKWGASGSPMLKVSDCSPAFEEAFAATGYPSAMVFAFPSYDDGTINCDC